MTNPTRKRRNQQNAKDLAQEAREVLASKTIKAKPDWGPWEDLTITDCTLIKQAVRERWDVCTESRRRIEDVLFNTTDSENDRLFLSAAGIIVDMDRQNLNADIAERRMQQLMARQHPKVKRLANRKKKK